MLIDVLYCVGHSLREVELPFEHTSFRCEAVQCFVPVPAKIEAELSCGVLQRLYAWGMTQLAAAERAKLRVSGEIARKILESLEADFSKSDDFIFSLSSHGHLNVVASPSYSARLIYRHISEKGGSDEIEPFGLSEAAQIRVAGVELSSFVEFSREDSLEGSRDSSPFLQKLRDSFPSAATFLGELGLTPLTYQDLVRSAEASAEDKLMFLAMCADPELDERRYLASLNTEANIPFFLKSMLRESTHFLQSLNILPQDTASLEAVLPKRGFYGEAKAFSWTHDAILRELLSLCFNARAELLSSTSFRGDRQRAARAIAAGRLFRSFYNHPGNRQPLTQEHREQASLIAALSASLVKEALADLTFC